MTSTTDLSPAAGQIAMLTLAFRDAATKTPVSGQGDPGQSGAELDGWRARLPAQLDGLVTAWQDPAAWEGMTEVGGIQLPGAVAGGFAATSWYCTAGTSRRRSASRSTSTRRRSRLA